MAGVQNSHGPRSQCTYSASTNKLTTPGFIYDAAGNLIQDLSATHTYQWDGEGRLISIDSGGTASTKFNAPGQRVYTNSSYFTGTYWRDPWGQFLGGMGSGSWSGEVPFAGRLLAEYTSGNPGPVYFDHPDALGSSQQWTDWAGNSAGEVDFYPWGALWGDSTNGTLFRFFASLEWYDPPVDGYQTSFRNLIPRFGRWLSPDPLGGDISNPQSLNRYAYAVNNPTSLVDPLGLDPCDSQDYSEPCDPCGDAFWQLLDIGCMPVGPGAPAPFPPIPPGGGGGGNGQFPEGTTPIPPDEGPCNGEPSCDSPWSPPWWLDLLPLGGLGALADQTAPNGQAQTPAQMSPCAQKVFGQVQNNLSGNWGYQEPLGPQGGHFNFGFSMSNGPYTASDFGPSWLGLNHGLRFGIIPSLHVPGTVPGADPLEIIAHLDFFNPFALYGLGLIPHEVVDVVLGHIIQRLGGNFGC